jgi:hypothetical protein
MWMGFTLSVLCSRSPMYIDKPPILAYVAETDFLQFKEQVSFQFKN